MKIKKVKDKIIVEIDFWSKRSNPYMPDEDVGEYPTLAGLIIRHKENGNCYDEIGFARLIDRDYKGKDEDIGSWAIMWYDGEDKFIEKCKELGVAIQVIDN